MKQKKLFYAQEKTKTGTSTRYQRIPIDIFAIEDEDGISLGKYILGLKKEIDSFRNQLELEKKMRTDLIKALGGKK